MCITSASHKCSCGEAQEDPHPPPTPPPAREGYAHPAHRHPFPFLLLRRYSPARLLHCLAERRMRQAGGGGERCCSPGACQPRLLPSLAFNKTVFATMFSSSIDKLRQRCGGVPVARGAPRSLRGAGGGRGGKETERAASCCP